jgi:hypothetical protein
MNLLSKFNETAAAGTSNRRYEPIISFRHNKLAYEFFIETALRPCPAKTTWLTYQEAERSAVFRVAGFWFT